MTVRIPRAKMSTDYLKFLEEYEKELARILAMTPAARAFLDRVGELSQETGFTLEVGNGQLCVKREDPYAVVLTAVHESRGRYYGRQRELDDGY